MWFTPDVVTDGIDLDLVARAGMEVLDHQAGLVGVDRALLVGAVTLVVHFVEILIRIDITAPADVETLRNAA